MLLAQEGQPPARYSPPVHIQPAAWSVLEADPEISAEKPESVPNTGYSQGQNIKNMAEYMRRQNEAVTRAQDAQVNAALYQLQQSRVANVQGRTAPQTARPRYAYPSQPVQPAAANRPQPRPIAANNQQQRIARPPQQVVRQQVPRQPEMAPQPQPRRGIGLQDRISHAIKRTFSRPDASQTPQPKIAQASTAQARTTQQIVAQPNVAQRIPQSVLTKPNLPQIGLVSHADSGEEPELLPMLADEPSMKRAAPPRQASTYRNLEYRPKAANNDRVIVPTFVDSEPEVLPELSLASTQVPVGSGLRSPRVSSRPQPARYVRPAPRQQEISVFRNASETSPLQETQGEDRLQQIENELNSGQAPGGQGELPQRTPEEDRPSLLQMDDQDAADEARKARRALDAQLDSLEDEDDSGAVVDDEDEDGPPVFDDRGCDELRRLLLDSSIREIALDISPPASTRRLEMGSLTRSWTDPSGNIIADGTMIDLRRGYVILESGQKLPYAKLSEADWAAIAENWLLPSVCAVGQRGSVERNWAPQTVTWHASSLCHKPLYFENIQLERYGHSRGPIMQPIHSTLHFFGSLFFVPYNTAINPPNECQYSLGLYRPGNCAPWLLDPIPFSRKGIRRQALIVTGLAFIP